LPGQSIDQSLAVEGSSVNFVESPGVNNKRWNLNFYLPFLDFVLNCEEPRIKQSASFNFIRSISWSYI